MVSAALCFALEVMDTIVFVAPLKHHIYTHIVFTHIFYFCHAAVVCRIAEEPPSVLRDYKNIYKK